MSAIAPPPNQRGHHSASEVLGERYSLARRIAVGGMGEVWEATDMVLGRQVAVKILRDDLVDSPVFLERFRAEARHTAGLAHHGIASVFDYGEDRDGDQCVAYLVMELVAGRPLSTVMAERGALPVGMALSLLAQAAEALHAAHALGVVHRDVKPGNLLLLDDGTIKVTDFGIARAANSVALTEVGQVIGTAMYISPEQAIGSEATPESDVYSLGVIGYEMLAGKPPFMADNAGALAMAHVHQRPPPLPTTLPAGVRAAIVGALAKDPADRPAGAAAFAANLRRLQLAIMPPPGSALGAPAEPENTELISTNDHPIPATALMGAETQSRTAIMPPSSIVAGDGDLGLSEEPYAARRQRRRIGLIALATVVVLIAVTQLRSCGADTPVVDITTTTPFVPTPTTVIAAIQIPTTTPAPTTVAGPGRKNDKPPKDKKDKPGP
ncbi:MAG TPA: serine/threonine-protein kinase [Ilumatobacteraceae bacterium]|nr:serine/threonine-protein kinase [Ilumatobacteraceae bacterium]